MPRAKQRAISVMHNHGFHEPGDTTQSPSTLNENPIVTRARLLGVDIPAVTGHKGAVGGGRLSAVQAEIIAIERSRSEDWRELPMTDSYRIRMRAVSAERTIEKLQTEIVSLRSKLKSLAEGDTESVLNLMSVEREYLLQGAQEAADTEKQLRQEIVTLQHSLTESQALLEEMTSRQSQTSEDTPSVINLTGVIDRQTTQIQELTANRNQLEVVLVKTRNELQDLRDQVQIEKPVQLAPKEVYAVDVPPAPNSKPVDQFYDVTAEILRGVISENNRLRTLIERIAMKGIN